MDELFKNWYEMIFPENRKLSFIGFNRVPVCRAWVDKFFTYYVVQYAESGEVDLQVDEGQTVRIQGPVVWLTYPGPHFRFGRRDGGSWYHRFVSFKGPLAEAYVRERLFPLFNPVIHISNPEKFSAAFDALLERLALSDSPEWRTLHQLEEILLQMSEQNPVTVPTSVRKLRQIAERLSADPPVSCDWKEIARKAGISYPHFRKLFHDLYHVPPGRFLLLRRLEKAAAMLRADELKTEEIATLCGFYDGFHFSKLFRKYYGVGPGRYRKAHSLES